MPFVLELLGFILSIAGIIGIIATILDWIRGILPTARLQYFDQIIIETEGFLQALGEDKIFSNPETLVHFRERLSTYVTAPVILLSWGILLCSPFYTACATWLNLIDGLHTAQRLPCSRLLVYSMDCRATCPSSATRQCD